MFSAYLEKIVCPDLENVFFVYVSYILFIYSFSVSEHTCHGLCVQMRGQLVGIASLLLPCESWRLNWGFQACWQMPLPAEPSCLPKFCILLILA